MKPNDRLESTKIEINSSEKGNDFQKNSHFYVESVAPRFEMRLKDQVPIK